MATFVDTNVFIHFLLGFDSERSERCHDLLRAVEAGAAALDTSDLVVAELVWFLERPPIRMTAPEVSDKLVPLFFLSGIRIPDKQTVLAALSFHSSSGLGFIDAYNAVVMRKRRIDRIMSYDTDFDRVPGITRIEP